MRNLFNKNKEHRGLLPIGDGEQLALGAQTNGRYYQSYNASYSTNWFGGKRPVQFSVSAYFSKQTDIASNQFNRSYADNYYNYLYGSSVYGRNSYESFYDPDKYITLFGVSLGWGRRLRWPDDYFHVVCTAIVHPLLVKELAILLDDKRKCKQLEFQLVVKSYLNR